MLVDCGPLRLLADSLSTVSAPWTLSRFTSKLSSSFFPGEDNGVRESLYFLSEDLLEVINLSAQGVMGARE